MKMPARAWAGTVIGLALADPQSPAQAVYTPYTFSTLAGGFSTPSGVVVDSAGNLYGTTYDGGVLSAGTVFRVRKPKFKGRTKILNHQTKTPNLGRQAS